MRFITIKNTSNNILDAIINLEELDYKIIQIGGNAKIANIYYK